MYIYKRNPERKKQVILARTTMPDSAHPQSMLSFLDREREKEQEKIISSRNGTVY